MRIDTSGNVGIGTSSPLSTSGLTVSKNSFSVTTPDGNFGAGGKRTFVDMDSVNNIGRIGALSGGIASGTALSFLYGAVTTGNAAEGMRIDSSGNLLVATTSQFGSGKVSVYYIPGTTTGLSFLPTTNASTPTPCIFLNAAGTSVGSIVTSVSGTSYNTTSDYRLKENVQSMAGALAKVAALKPVTYKWKVDESAGEGFIAHELAEVCPHAVTGEKDAVETYKDEDGNEQTRPKYQGIDTSFLVATLTAAIQELKALTDAQASTITALTARITALENK
jgi:hypothetical protein